MTAGIHPTHSISAHLRIREAPPTLKNVTGVLKTIRNNKVPDVDGIPAELLKIRSVDMATRPYEFINTIWSYEIMPEDCRIDTKCGKFYCKKYRGISLLCTCGKVLPKIIERNFEPSSNK